MIDPFSLLLGLGACVAAGWVAVARSEIAARRARTEDSSEEEPLDLHTYKRRDIGDFPAPGVGKISGRVRALDHHRLEAPFAETRCAAFVIRIELHESLERPRGAQPVGRVIHLDTRVVPFVVEDHTGEALVSPTAHTLQLHERFVAEASTSKPLPPLFRRLLGATPRLPEGHTLSCHEGFLPFDSMVAVVGHGELGVSADDGESDYRKASSQLVLGPLDDGRFLISNLSFNPPE